MFKVAIIAVLAAIGLQNVL